MNHSKDNWADPWAFKPERFLSDSEEAAKAGNQLDALQPFNVGPRNCIGRKYGVFSLNILFLFFTTLFLISSPLSNIPDHLITPFPPNMHSIPHRIRIVANQIHNPPQLGLCGNAPHHGPHRVRLWHEARGRQQGLDQEAAGVQPLG